jgi:hypothetical protein
VEDVKNKCDADPKGCLDSDPAEFIFAGLKFHLFFHIALCFILIFFNILVRVFELRSQMDPPCSGNATEKRNIDRRKGLQNKIAI